MRNGTTKMRITPRFPNIGRKIASWKFRRFIISGELKRMYIIDACSYPPKRRRKKYEPITTNSVNITYAMGVVK